MREPPDDANLPKLASGALIDHLEMRYHAAHRRELAELVRSAAQLEAAHPGDLPRRLAASLGKFARLLDTHMEKEEAILFPFLRRGGGTMVTGTIALMRAEHEEHLAWIARLAAQTNGFEPPPAAGAAWRALYAGLSKFADDLTEHIRIENDILFPRFPG